MKKFIGYKFKAADRLLGKIVKVLVVLSHQCLRMVWSVTVNKGTFLNNYHHPVFKSCICFIYVCHSSRQPISILPINHWSYHGNVHLAQWYVKGVIYTGVGIGFHYPASIIPRETERLREREEKKMGIGGMARRVVGLRMMPIEPGSCST